MRAASLLLVCCIPASFTVTALADESFRCGNSVVSSSMSVAQLLEKCGAPSSKQSRTEDIRTSGPNCVKVGTTTTETWRYERSGAQAMVATIVDGRLRSLQRQR